MRNDFCSDYLEHSAKGTTWGSVKYIKKVPMGNGQYYYIYTQEQLAAYNKRHSGGSGTNNVTNVLSNEKKQEIVSSGASLEQLARNGFSVKGNTPQEKTANMEKAISDGEKKISETLSTDSTTKSSSKKSGSSSSSSKSGSGSKKSKSSSGSKSKGSSGGSSKDKSSEKKSASSKEKTTTKTNKKNEKLEEKATLESLMKSNGKSSKDAETHKMSAQDFKKKMKSKYKEGSFGYLSSGNKVYKWTITNGQLMLYDVDSGKEMSFDYYLKDAEEFKEFETNKKK